MLTRRVGQWPVLDYRKCLRRVFLLFLCGQDQLQLSLRDGQCPVLAYKRKEEGRKELPRASAQFLGRYLPFYFFIKDGPRICCAARECAYTVIGRQILSCPSSCWRPNDWRYARMHTSDSHPDNGRLILDHHVVAAFMLVVHPGCVSRFTSFSTFSIFSDQDLI